MTHGAEPKNDPAALNSVVAGGYLKLLDWFLEKGADVNAKALIASEKNFGELSALMVALRMKHEAVFQRLMAENPDVNIATAQGFTALHAAAETGYASGVKQLLEQGANLDAVWRDERGRGSISLIRRQELSPSVPDSAEAEAPEGIKGEGTTPLSLAVRAASVECVSLLLAAGAKADEPDEGGIRLCIMLCKLTTPPSPSR